MIIILYLCSLPLVTCYTNLTLNSTRSSRVNSTKLNQSLPTVNGSTSVSIQPSFDSSFLSELSALTPSSEVVATGPQAVIIGSSTFTASSSIQTISQSDGPPIILGPSDIAVGSNTAHLPNPTETSPTVITLGSTTMSLASDASTMQPTSAGITTQPSPALESSGGPSGTASLTAQSPPIASKPPPAMLVTVNGVQYVNPQQEQTLQQSDGSSFTLGVDYIVYEGYKYSFGSITSSTSLVSGSAGDVTVAPGSPPKPPSSGGLLDALDGLTKTAGNTFKSLEGIQQSATSWASGQMSSSEFGSMFPDDPSSGPAIGKIVLAVPRAVISAVFMIPGLSTASILIFALSTI